MTFVLNFLLQILFEMVDGERFVFYLFRKYHNLYVLVAHFFFPQFIYIHSTIC
jgi:hypothetical protein